MQYQTTFFIFFRSLNDIYLDLMWNGLDDIERRTGCQKPCVFKKYSFPGDRQVCKYRSCLGYQMCTAGNINEIKYLSYLPIIIFGQIVYFANIYYILIKYAGDLTEIGPFHFLFGSCFKHLIYPLSSLVSKIIFLIFLKTYLNPVLFSK